MGGVSDKYGGVICWSLRVHCINRLVPISSNYMDIYGTDHIYQTDTYNEMDPKTSDPDYLKASSGAVYNAMKIADPSSVWLMQGWLFKHKFWQDKEIKAYLEGVPKGGMIVLDLAANSRPVCKKSQSFYGHQFIWCTLLHWGTKVFGNVNAIGDGISTALGLARPPWLALG